LARCRQVTGIQALLEVGREENPFAAAPAESASIARGVEYRKRPGRDS